MSWFSEEDENSRLKRLEEAVEDLRLQLRRLQVELMSRLENSMAESKELKTLWKARIARLENPEREKQPQTHRNLLGMK